MLLVSCLLILVCTADLLQGQPYQVTSKKFPGCDSKLEIQANSLRVSRGDQDAPCVGYLKWKLADDDSRRICQADGGDFQEAWAKRACFTLGLDLNRKEGQVKGNRLYRCDAYTEDDTDHILDHRNEDVVTLRKNFPHFGKRCRTGGILRDFDCFDKCYPLRAPRSGGSAAATNPAVSAAADAVANPAADAAPNPAANPAVNPVANPLAAIPPFAVICDDVFWAITCSDVNECATGALTDCTNPYDDSCTVKKACGGNSTCQNLIGSYKCTCNNGYKYANGDETDPYHDDRGCIDIDECEGDDDICGENGQCANIPGTYTCSCLHPALLNSVTGKCEGELCGCPPFDPYSKTNCASNIGLPNEEFTYMCRDGYTTSTDGKQYIAKCFNGEWTTFGLCTDVNECLSSPCGVNKVCINQPGTYVCQCAQGFSGDGRTCTPIVNDPCATLLGLGFCLNGVCTVVDGKPKCTCDGNFEGSSCDVPRYGTPFILGAVALAGLGLHVGATLLFLVLQAARTPRLPLPPPPQRVFDPIYGQARPPLPPLRRRPFF